MARRGRPGHVEVHEAEKLTQQLQNAAAVEAPALKRHARGEVLETTRKAGLELQLGAARARRVATEGVAAHRGP